MVEDVLPGQSEVHNLTYRLPIYQQDRAYLTNPLADLARFRAQPKTTCDLFSQKTVFLRQKYATLPNDAILSL